MMGFMEMDECGQADFLRLRCREAGMDAKAAERFVRHAIAAGRRSALRSALGLVGLVLSGVAMFVISYVAIWIACAATAGR